MVARREALEAEQAELAAQVGTGGTRQQMDATLARLAVLEEALTQAYARWEELETLAVGWD